ncbi:MAG: cation:proton antiporter, partial [Candidatus Hadarchaeota archaeon]
MPDPILNAIALLAFTILAGYATDFIFRRTKVPDVVILLLFGLAIGYLGFVRVDLFRAIAPILTPLTLIVVLLDSGLNMELAQVIRSFSRSILLAIGGLIFSMVASAIVGVLVMGLDLKMALLVGAIFGGTSSVTVLAILRGISVSKTVYSFLSLESVFNDALCILVSIAVLGTIIPGLGAGSSPL